MSGKANKTIHTAEILGLETFQRNLEKDFFAETSIQTITDETTPNKKDLIINLDCNFGLTESLFHLNKGNWGNFVSSNNNYCNGFQEIFASLSGQNDLFDLDIQEFSVHLRDCSIVVSRLYPNSVIENLSSVFDAVSEHFVHLTKGLCDMPAEVFVPVFEEKSNFGQDAIAPTYTKKDYFNFWGLYFNDNESMVVYDFATKSILGGDFFLTN